MNTLEERYVCSKCLKIKDVKKVSFGIVWTNKKGKNIFVCKECANGILAPKKKP